MRNIFVRTFASTVVILGVASMPMWALGCGKVSKLVGPRNVCLCAAIWHNPLCQTGQSYPPDSAVFIVPCPDGLEPKADASVSSIKPTDVDFDEMADSTVKQIIAWTGMNLRKSTGTTNGQFYGDVDPTTSRHQYAQVFGCGVARLGENESPEDVKTKWSYKNAKPHMGPWNTSENDAGMTLPEGEGGSAGVGGSVPYEPPPPPTPGAGGSPSADTDPCDNPMVDQASQTVTLPAGCPLPIEVHGPSDLGAADFAACTVPTCPSDPTDSTCVSCGKQGCCYELTACLNDDTCVNAAQCVLSSGGQASCTGLADSTAYILQTCLSSKCGGCAAPASNCGQVGDLCGVGHPACCANKGLSCFGSDTGVETCM